MEDFEKRICEYNRYQTNLDNAKKRISEMSEDQIKKILEFAQGQNNVTQLNGEDKLVITVICQDQAQKQVSDMTEPELVSKQKEIWNKHVKHCTEGTEQLTRYESEFLRAIEKRLREIQKTENENVKE